MNNEPKKIKVTKNGPYLISGNIPLDKEIIKSDKDGYPVKVCNCPSGSLVIIDRKTEKPIEPDLKPFISILEDPDKEVGGPIQVKGGIPVESSEGFKYETRNRVTLCRCGKSDNKPFCDGNHITVGFEYDSD